MISEATEAEMDENRESVARVDLIRTGVLAFLFLNQRFFLAPFVLACIIGVRELIQC